MKKIVYYTLLLIGISALLWVCAEPKALDLSWAIGEVVGMAIMVLAFRSANSIKK